MIARTLFALFAAGVALGAAAQPFPARPVKLVVPHAPGGNSDTFGRILAAKLSERLGQQVIVENRAGAGGTVASEFVARQAPDGYTLLVGDNGTHGIAPTLYAKLPYKVPQDFTAITLAATFPTLLLAHPSLPAKNVAEFVALVKANPGKYTYSSAGTGNGSHLTVDMFLQAAGGLQMVHVPYKGGAPAVQALLAGDVQLTAVSVNTGLPHVKSGKVRALAIASLRRSPAVPEVPTLAEQGVKGAEADSWLAIFGPAGIPEPIVAKLHQEIAAALNDPPIRERLAGIGLEVVASTPAQLSAMLPGEVAKWGEAVRRSGARVD
ncbi:MAG: tripartite tricarboxylate transporter substrate binding protein [Burkholderiales bacterium]|nr:tripartite tricarboxylate transporter substrate binding protein [Burkholderiales bacterium]